MADVGAKHLERAAKDDGRVTVDVVVAMDGDPLPQRNGRQNAIGRDAHIRQRHDRAAYRATGSGIAPRSCLRTPAAQSARRSARTRAAVSRSAAGITGQDPTGGGLRALDWILRSQHIRCNNARTTEDTEDTEVKPHAPRRDHGTNPQVGIKVHSALGAGLLEQPTATAVPSLEFSMEGCSLRISSPSFRVSRNAARCRLPD